MNNHDLNALDMAKIVGRGGTSGIGVESFENGGFIIDGGHKRVEKPSFLPSSASPATPPPIIARYNFPLDWKIILAIPNVERGVSGAKNNIQNIGFKKIENKLQNPYINEIMKNLRIAGAAGVGMSSFGPTVYAITDTNERDILSAANDSLKDVGGEIISTCARNYGATLLD